MAPDATVRGRPRYLSRLVSTRRRKAVVAVVVALLLLETGAYLFNMFGGFPGRPQDEPPPGDLLDGPSVSTEMEYSNVSGILTKQVTVWGPDAVLRLVDCDLTVPLEDLVFTGSSNGLIYAWGGASIELVRTTIRVVADPNLTRAVGTYGVDYSADPDYTTFIARVLNLRGATHPTLSLNVSWRERSSELLVMGCELPDGEFRLLGSLPLVQMPPMSWSHLEFDLSALAGRLARLAIAPLAPITGRMFISDMRVTDGGLPLPHDAPMSGEPYKDGWEMRGFGAFGDSFGWRARPLLSSEPGITDGSVARGSVTITDSTIEMPDGIGRTTWADQGYGGSGWPSTLLQDVMAVTSRGGDVRIVNGRIALSGSHINNVPVNAEDANVDISDTVLEGDATLLSLQDAGGAVDNVDFVSRAPPPGTDVMRGITGAFAWAVFAQGAAADRPLIVRDCTFEGSDVALCLNRTDARVSGCEFRNITRLAVWDRDSTGLGSWDALSVANEFVDCTGHRYLRTTVCELDYSFPSVSEDGWDPYVYDATVLEPVPPLVPDLPLVDTGSSKALLLLPDVSVGPDGAVHDIDHVRVSFNAGWPLDDMEQNITTGTRHDIISFNLTEAGGDGGGAEPRSFEDYVNESLGHWISDLQYSLGTIDVTYEFYLEGLQPYNVSDLRAEILLDGVHESEADLWALGQVQGLMPVQYSLSVNIGVGRHVLDVVLSGVREGWGTRRDFTHRTHEFMRVDASVPPSEVFDYLNETGGDLMVDPGCEVVLRDAVARADGSDPWDEGWPSWWLSAYVAEGARLVVDGVRGNETSFLSVWAHGAGELELRNASCASSWINSFGATLSVIDSNLSYLSLYGGPGADIRLVRTRIDHILWNVRIIDSNLTLDGCTWTYQEDPAVGSSPLYIEATHSTVRIHNTTFATVEANTSTVTIYRANHLDVSGCTFTGTGLEIGVDFRLEATGETAYLDVRDSTFSGRGAFLLAQVTNRRSNDRVIGNITGNTFSGPNATLAFDSSLLDGVMGENTFLAGASAFQMLWWWVDARYIDDPDPYQGLSSELLWEDMVLQDPPQEITAWALSSILFFNVTGDPASVIDRPVTIMFKGVNGHEVVWFEDATLQNLPSTVRLQQLPDISVLIEAIRAPLVEALDWWTD